MNDDYDRVTAADIAEFTRYLIDLRYGHPRAGNPAEYAIFLARKADLLIRIAVQHIRTDLDYAQHALRLARAAHTAAEQAALELPHQRVGPTFRRTLASLPDSGYRTQ
jgi:hypothetical protein